MFFVWFYMSLVFEGKKHEIFPLQSVRLTCAKWQQMEDVCSGRVIIEPGLWCDSVSDYSPPWCWEQIGLSPGNTLLLLRLWLHPSHQNHELGFWKDLLMGILEMVNPDLWAMDSLNFRLRGFMSDSNTTWIDSPPHSLTCGGPRVPTRPTRSYKWDQVGTTMTWLMTPPCHSIPLLGCLRHVHLTKALKNKPFLAPPKTFLPKLPLRSSELRNKTQPSLGHILTPFLE